MYSPNRTRKQGNNRKETSRRVPTTCIRDIKRKAAEVPNASALSFAFAPVQTGIWYAASKSQTLLLSVKLAGQNEKQKKMFSSSLCYFKM